MAAAAAAKSMFLSMPARTVPNARLVCVPYAGGGPAVFAGWRLPDVDVLALRLPGRESRWREAPLRTIAAMAEQLAAAVTPLAHELPLALFGHSMGALVAYEAARRLTRDGVPPLLLIVGGSGAPSLLRPPDDPLHALDDVRFIGRIEQEFGDMPAEVKNDPELMRMTLPWLRADFEANETYEHQEGALLDCPLLVLAGTEEELEEPELEGWRTLTTGKVEVRRVAGGHFFIRTSSGDVLRLVQDSITAALRAVH